MIEAGRILGGAFEEWSRSLFLLPLTFHIAKMEISCLIDRDVRSLVCFLLGILFVFFGDLKLPSYATYPSVPSLLTMCLSTSHCYILDGSIFQCRDVGSMLSLFFYF